METLRKTSSSFGGSVLSGRKFSLLFITPCSPRRDSFQHNGSLFDFESWLSSSPPEVAEYLQAHAFRITEVLNAQPSASSTSASVWSSPAESSTERHGSMPTATDLKSPARIGHGTAIAEAAGRRPTSEREHQSMIVATSGATGPSNLVTESNLFLETSASGPASNAGVLPVITLATPSSVSQSSVPITAPAQSPSIQTTRSILEAHLASRPSGTPGRPPGVQVSILLYTPVFA